MEYWTSRQEKSCKAQYFPLFYSADMDDFALFVIYQNLLCRNWVGVVLT